MIILAYFGLLRIGEISQSPHTIKAWDIHVGTNKDELMQSSKTHGKHQKPQIIKLNREMKKPSCWDFICPYVATHEYTAIRPGCTSKNENFFVYRDKSPVKPNTWCNILKHCIEKISLDPVLYAFHGIRGGRACDLLKLGLSVDTIKTLGRWKSNAVYIYLR